MQTEERMGNNSILLDEILQTIFTQFSLLADLLIKTTFTYAITGTLCVESENVMKSTMKKIYN